MNRRALTIPTTQCNYKKILLNKLLQQTIAQLNNSDKSSRIQQHK